MPLRSRRRGLRQRQRLWQAQGLSCHDDRRQCVVDLGQPGFLKTGVEGGFEASNPGDKLIDLVYAVKAGYRANGTFVFNRATQRRSARCATPTATTSGSPPHALAKLPLDGFPVAESEDMPNIATNSLSVAFGRFPPRLPDR